MRHASEPGFLSECRAGWWRVKMIGWWERWTPGWSARSSACSSQSSPAPAPNSITGSRWVAAVKCCAALHHIVVYWLVMVSTQFLLGGWLVFTIVRDRTGTVKFGLNLNQTKKTHPYRNELNHTKPNSSIPNRTQPHQTKLIHTKPNSSIPNRTQSHQAKLIQSRPKSTTPNHTHPYSIPNRT